MVTILIIGMTLDAIGAVLVAYTVLQVHDRVRKERAIDAQVIKKMKQERTAVIIGVILIIVGYIFQVLGLLG
ncbi:hypothetical protein GW918_02875 [Candidatus Berkelbacteria bacterium]|nr:hypothetical protein [Candidatus Berkelbacteria bacterium]OIP05400.1 MAG: hypothetical protein AUK14_01680 [Candidatus Berkelbacteria bacterium CG2_30_39_44]